MTTQHLGGIRPEDYWEYQPGEHVMTIDGFPGVVELVEDGPIGGAENYAVKLDNGMGGGNYSASMLAKMPTSRAAAGVHLAVEDYPELGGILDERPDPGKMTFAAALSAERQEADVEDHDEPGGNDTPSSCSYCGSTDFQDLTDNGRVRQATCATCGGTMSAHPGMQWTPELIGDPSNHPSPAVDPRSGASIGTGSPGQAGINDFVDFDSRVSTTAAYEAGPCPTCKGKGTVSWADEDPDWEGEPEENPGKVHTAPCDDCDGKGHVPAVSDDEIARAKQQAEEKRARSTAQHVQEKHPIGEVVTYDDVKGCGPRCPVAAEWDRRGKQPFYHQGAVDGPDWCTWRRTARCTYPGDISAGGHVLGIPQDRGPCPWETRWQQQVCPISEPGPMALMQHKGSVNLTLLKIAGVPTLPDRVGSSATTAALEARVASDEDDYRMQHQAPDADYGAPLHDVTKHMHDFYENPHYFHGGLPHDQESARVIQNARHQPDKMIHVYRALPAEHAHKGIRPGDWVSTSKDYARGEGRMNDPKDDYPVIRARVPAKHLHTEGDVNEWGYNGPETVHGMVVYKGGHNQEVRHNADGIIKQVQRRSPKEAVETTSAMARLASQMAKALGPGSANR